MRRVVQAGRVTGWLVAVSALAVGCRGQEPAPPSDERAAVKAEITALWTQLRDWRREAGLDVDPSPPLVLAMRAQAGQAAASAASVCAVRATPPACNEVCDLGTAICDNAAAICELAAQLAPDDWAAQKCASAKASCREAEERCCACRESIGDEFAP